jgi:hypothetical protein
MENKTAKYLKYAIGEIFLVVIGILIALTINNSNENRINKKNVHHMLKAIKAENLINIDELTFKIEDSKHVRKTLIYLLSSMGENFLEKDEYLIDSLFFEGLSITLFDPNKASFTNLINSGHIKYIRNQILHDLLLEWSSKLDDLKSSQAMTLHSFKTLVIPHFYDKISLVKIDREFDITENENLPASAFQWDNRQALNSMETENILEDHLYNLEKIEKSYERFYKELKLLNVNIEKEIER